MRTKRHLVFKLAFIAALIYQLIYRLYFQDVSKTALPLYGLNLIARPVLYLSIAYFVMGWIRQKMDLSLAVSPHWLVSLTSGLFVFSISKVFISIPNAWIGYGLNLLTRPVVWVFLGCLWSFRD